MKMKAKQTMRRGLAGALLAATLLSISAIAISAHAAETDPAPSPAPSSEATAAPQYPQTLEMAATVKTDASTASLKSIIEEKLKEQYKDYPIETVVWPETVDFTSDGDKEMTVHYKGGTTAAGTVTIKAVAPNGIALAKTLPNVSSMSAYNKDQTALLAYVNSDLVLTNTGDNEYASALGASAEAGKAPAFTWAHCDTNYNSKGGKTYSFTQILDGKTISRAITVSADAYNVGRLYIDYDDGTVNTTKSMKWSLNRNASTWNTCRDNMPIETSWYDRTVYFYIPGDGFASSSDAVSLYIPPKAEKPDGKLELTSTSKLITIENCWDFDNIEFRVGTSGHWYTSKNETYTFDGLAANTSYTVYARTRSDSGDYLFSDAISAKISTKAPVLTKVEVETKTTNRIGYVDAVATIAPGSGTRTMSGSLSSSNLTKFNSVITTYDDRYNRVEATLLVEQFIEDGRGSGISTITFSTPMSALKRAIQDADLTMEYQNDFGRVYLTNDELDYFYNKGSNNLNISMQEVSSINSGSAWEWLRNAKKRGCPVYKLSVTSGNRDDGTATYFLPYPLKSGETITSLSVYHADSKGTKTTISFEYDSTLGGVRFNTSKNGYFTIINDKSDYKEMPFEDVAGNYWAKDYIQYCYDKGLFVGTSDTTFSPEETISRAEIIALLSRLDNFDGKSSGTRYFSDVKQGDWFAMYAGWAYDKGIVSAGQFNGEGEMQRQHIAKMLYSYLKKSGFDTDVDTDEVERYRDMNTIANTTRPAILFLRSTGIMDGTGNNYFSPNETVTRAQMAAIMYRMLKYTA